MFRVFKTTACGMSILACMAAGCQQPGPRAGYAAFGAPIPAKRALSLEQAVARAETLADTPVVIKARIGDVCKKRGCWMTLTDADRAQQVRVRFTASDQCTDGFFVPRNASGHDAYVHGILKADRISEELARHYAEDEGRSPDDIKRIVGPQPVVTMVATGVMISDASTLDQPAD